MQNTLSIFSDRNQEIELYFSVMVDINNGKPNINTAINTVRENTISFPDTNQARPATMAIITTTGTKYPAIISAIFAIGALDP